MSGLFVASHVGWCDCCQSGDIPVMAFNSDDSSASCETCFVQLSGVTEDD